MRLFVRISLFMLFCCSLPSFALSQPGIRFQGTLTDAAGAYLNGSYPLTLRLYTQQSGGSPVFTQTYSSVGVHNGLFECLLDPAGIPRDSSCYVEIDVAGETLLPRVALTAVPYSISALRSDTARYAWRTQISDTSGYSFRARMSDTSAFSSRSAVSDSSLLAQHSHFSDTAAFVINGGVTGAIAGGDLTGQYPAPVIRDSAITGRKIAKGTITTPLVAQDFRAPYSDTARFALITGSAPGMIDSSLDFLSMNSFGSKSGTQVIDTSSLNIRDSLVISTRPWLGGVHNGCWIMPSNDSSIIAFSGSYNFIPTNGAYLNVAGRYYPGGAMCGTGGVQIGVLADAGGPPARMEIHGIDVNHTLRNMMVYFAATGNLYLGHNLPAGVGDPMLGKFYIDFDNGARNIAFKNGDMLLSNGGVFFGPSFSLLDNDQRRYGMVVESGKYVGFHAGQTFPVIAIDSGGTMHSINGGLLEADSALGITGVLDSIGTVTLSASPQATIILDSHHALVTGVTDSVPPYPVVLNYRVERKKGAWLQPVVSLGNVCTLQNVPYAYISSF